MLIFTGFALLVSAIFLAIMFKLNWKKSVVYDFKTVFIMAYFIMCAVFHSIYVGEQILKNLEVQKQMEEYQMDILTKLGCRFAPWKPSKSGHPNFDECIVSNDGGSVCFLTNWPSAEVDKNIIAAAPEMLEVLIYQCLSLDNSGEYLSTEMWPDVIKIIEKATARKWEDIKKIMESVK